MFEDFFSGGGKDAAKDGGISGQGRGGVSGAGATAAGRDADEDKLSDQQAGPGRFCLPRHPSQLPTLVLLG